MKVQVGIRRPAVVLLFCREIWGGGGAGVRRKGPCEATACWEIRIFEVILRLDFSANHRMGLCSRKGFVESPLAAVIENRS